MQNLNAEQLLRLTSRALLANPVAGLDHAYVERWLGVHRAALIALIENELARHAAVSLPPVPPVLYGGEAARRDGVGTFHERRASQLWELRPRVGLYVVTCGAAKASDACAAADLYTSGYFRDNLAAARALAGSDDGIRILSAKHGLVRVDDWLEPYELRLGEEGTVSREVLAQQLEATGGKGVALVFGGHEYVELLRQATGQFRSIVHAYAELGGGLPAQRAVARAVVALADGGPAGLVGPDDKSAPARGVIAKSDCRPPADRARMAESDGGPLPPSRTGDSRIREHNAGPLEKCAVHGPGCLTDVELVALALSGGDSRRSARLDAAAHRLLEQMGGIGPLLEMSAPELRAAGGVRDGEAVVLTAVGELARRIAQPRAEGRLQIRTAQDVFDAYHARLSPLNQEVFMVLLLDTRNRRIDDVTVARGSLTEAVVHPREVFLPAVRASAAGILVLHNHPSGDPEPSMADLELTRRLVGAGKVLGIRVVDHVIVGRGRFVSLGERGVIRD